MKLKISGCWAETKKMIRTVLIQESDDLIRHVLGHISLHTIWKFVWKITIQIDHR